MKKSLEDIVEENRSLFDDFEPYEGHFERFRKKLNSKVQKDIKSIVPYLLKAAVVSLLVTLSSLWVFDNFIVPLGKNVKISRVSPEYKETEAYYMRQVELKENELYELDFSNNPEQLEMLQKELIEMDEVYSQLKKDLKKNSNDQRVINAMIDHYQTKLNVMSYIVNQLKEVQSENSNIEDNEKDFI